MLIKTKLVSSGSLQVGLLVLVGMLVLYTFAALSSQLDAVVSAAHDSADGAEQTALGSEQSAKTLSAVSQDMLEIVDGIAQANQRTKLIGRQVSGISETLETLNDSVEMIADSIDSEALQDILYDISDEIGDISNRLSREAMLSISESSQKLDDFSSRISLEAEQMAELDSFLMHQVDVSQATREQSQSIAEQAAAALGAINSQRQWIVLALLTVGAVSALSVVLMLRGVVRPIDKTVCLMQDIADVDGDLTRRLELKGNDEMAMIARSFNRFAEKIQTVLQDVSASTHRLIAVTQQTQQAMSSGNQSIETQQAEFEQIVAALDEMIASSETVAANTHSAADATREASEHASGGKTIFSNAHRAVAGLAESLENAMAVIESLSQKSSDINNVVEVIRGVSEQTNLLALNAAIEAARAGEQGRGFAVVADEVRQLAAKTESSTDDIRHIIDDVRTLTQQAVDVMTASREASVTTLQEADRASQALQAISDSMLTMESVNAQTASAATEQTAVSEGIGQRAQQAKSLSASVLTQMNETVQSCAELADINRMLTSQLQQFKI